MNEQEILDLMAEQLDEEVKKYNDWATCESKNRAAINIIGIIDERENGDRVNFNTTCYGSIAGNSHNVGLILLHFMQYDKNFEKTVLTMIVEYIASLLVEHKIVGNINLLSFFVNLKKVLKLWEKEL